LYTVAVGRTLLAKIECMCQINVLFDRIFSTYTRYTRPTSISWHLGLEWQNSSQSRIHTFQVKMYQFTATLSGSYPPVQQQTQKIHGVRREDGWNQNFQGVLDTNIKQEFPDPRQNPLFENAGYGAPSTSNGWPRQTGITPLQVSPQPLFNRDPHAQERQLLEYHDRQPPSEYDGLADKSIPTQNIVHRNVTYPPPFVNERPIRHLEYPPTANQSPSITYGSFSSSQSEHHRKKAPRVSQASIHYMLPWMSLLLTLIHIRPAHNVARRKRDARMKNHVRHV
jgi:hypothetical protein